MLFVLLHRNITHVSVSIHTSLAWNPKTELRCIPLIILQMFLQLHWTPSVVNSVDWTWFGKAPACLYKVPCWRCMSEHKPGVKSKESSANLPDRFVWRRRSGEGYRNISAALTQASVSAAPSLVHKRRAALSQSWLAIYAEVIGQEGETVNLVLDLKMQRWFGAKI